MPPPLFAGEVDASSGGGGELGALDGIGFANERPGAWAALAPQYYVHPEPPSEIAAQPTPPPPSPGPESGLQPPPQLHRCVLDEPAEAIPQAVRRRVAASLLALLGHCALLKADPAACAALCALGLQAVHCPHAVN